jgi:hypothetical protein
MYRRGLLTSYLHRRPLRRCGMRLEGYCTPAWIPGGYPENLPFLKTISMHEVLWTNR